MAKVQRRPRRTPTRASKKTRVLMSLLKLVRNIVVTEKAEVAEAE